MKKILNSKAYQVFDYICRLIILNIMLIIGSFSIFIICSKIFPNLNDYLKLLLIVPTLFLLYPSIVAIASVLKGYETNEYSGVFKEFFRSFKKYYLKTLVVNIILILVVALLYNSYTYFNAYKTTGIAYLIGYILTISFSLILIFMFLHLMLVFIYFDDLKLTHYVKLSFVFAFKDLGLTLILTLIVVSSIILSYFFAIYLLLLGFSLPIFFIIILTKKKYLIISERNKE